MINLMDWAKEKKIAFLSPYNTPRGRLNKEIVNGITGVPFTFNEEGADFYWYHDIKNLPHEELIEIFNEYDVWLYPVYPEYFDMVLKIREEYNGKILGVTDIQTHQLSYWNLQDISKFVSAINCYDAIMATNQDEVETFRGCLKDKKKIEYTGWSLYPNEIHTKYFRPKEQRDKNLVSVGISNPGDFNRDILTNLTVYNELKKLKPELKGFMYYVTPNKVSGLREVVTKMDCKDFALVTELPYDVSMDYLSKAYMAIHMYTFKVVGRLAQDCAALGVPMVGTIANLPNRLCFPDTSVFDYDIKSAVKLAHDLLNDEGFYDHVSEKARQNAYSFYGLEATRDRIFKLLQQNNLA